jgi:hypothetical protein
LSAEGSPVWKSLISKILARVSNHEADVVAKPAQHQDSAARDAQLRLSEISDAVESTKAASHFESGSSLGCEVVEDADEMRSASFAGAADQDLDIFASSPAMSAHAQTQYLSSQERAKSPLGNEQLSSDDAAPEWLDQNSMHGL